MNAKINDKNVATITAPEPLWKGRHRIDAVVKELERQLASRLDVIASTPSLTATFRGNALALDIYAVTRTVDKRFDVAAEYMTGGARLNEVALSQLCARLSPAIPVDFLRKLGVEHREVTERLVTGMLHDQKNDSRLLLRMLDGNVRAVLSPSYKVLDHTDVAFEALRTIQKHNGVVIEATLSDRNMKLKFTTPEVVGRMERAFREHGDHHWERFGGNETVRQLRAMPEMPTPFGASTVYPVCTVSNSETGQGMFAVSYGVLLSWCTNLVMVEKQVEVVHLGSKMPTGMLTQETISMRSKATALEARDAIASAFKPERFAATVETMNAAGGVIVSDPVIAVDNVVKAFTAVRKDERDALLTYFTRDYSQTQLGLSQAIARLAQDVSDVDRANDLEEVAGEVMYAGVRTRS